MARLKWTTLLGLLSVLLTLLFWLLAAISTRTRVHYPGELAGVMTSLLAAIILAGIAAARGSKWWLVAVVAALGTAVTVVSRLH